MAPKNLGWRPTKKGIRRQEMENDSLDREPIRKGTNRQAKKKKRKRK